MELCPDLNRTQALGRDGAYPEKAATILSRPTRSQALRFYHLRSLTAWRARHSRLPTQVR